MPHREPFVAAPVAQVALSPARSAEADEQIRALEETLEEKEQLITALTVQLEEACERLDRIHRMGSDRGGTVGGGGVPREFVEDQRTVLDELQEAVKRLEEMQADATLGRLEMQIGELRDLVIERTAIAPAPVMGAASHERDAENEPSGRSWESTKSSRLGDDSHSGETSYDLRAGLSESELQEAPDWVAPPPNVDLAGFPETARTALESRDEYIVWLIRRLRTAESEKYAYAAPQSEDETPDEFQQRLAELQVAFDQKQRMAEIELSIERARLAREDAQVRMNREKLQTDLRRAGQENAVAQPPGDGKEQESPKNRRWRRMLGMGSDEK